MELDRIVVIIFLHKFSILAIFLLVAFQGFSQSEVKLYTTGFERVGVGFEYFIDKHTAVELGSSFWVDNSSNFFIDADVDNRDIDFYITTMVRRYSAKKLNNAGFFYGAYVRYWMNFSTIVDEENWTIAQLDFAENNDNTWRSTQTHKVSVGGLIGYKTQMDKKVNFGFTLGIGTSVPSTFWEVRTNYDYTEIQSYPGDNSILGDLVLLNIIGQVSVAYRFVKIDKNSAAK